MLSNVQVCLQAAANVAEKHMGRVVYLDTSNSFSPQRIACFLDLVLKLCPFVLIWYSIWYFVLFVPLFSSAWCAKFHPDLLIITTVGYTQFSPECYEEHLMPLCV